MTFRFAPARPPTVALNAMVATSQPLATRAGMRALERGGNAADAALAAAAVLCVTEPMSTGLGGDVFALIWQDGKLTALDAAGPAPRNPDTDQPVASGRQSVTVPGAVAGWAALAARHGKLGLDRCLEDAIDTARRGFAVGAHTARLWTEAEHAPRELAPPPLAGARVVMPDLADTLSAVAADGPDAVYQGRVAAAICESSWLDETDLAAYEPDWVDPLSLRYRDVEVVELPPPTQGVAALEALGIYEHMQPGLISEVAAVQRSLEDAFRFVRDGADVGHLLAARHLRQRCSEATRGVNVPDGGTIYLCVVDQDRMAVSFIQSIFGHFGSGLVAPGTGIVLNNRAACFAVAGVVDPGRRPYHTIIPGMLLKNGELLGPFGVMGGLIQPQAHVQLIRAIVDDHCDPQAALDRPRFRIDGSDIHLEPGYWQHAEELRQLGLTPVCSEQTTPFGGGQAILARGDSLLGGSDARRDGHAAGM